MNELLQKSKRIFYFLFVVFSGTLILSSCKSYNRNSTHEKVSLSSIKKGEELAKIYCQSCHQLPDPSLLDSKTWEKGVLPQMGPRLGIFNYGFETYPTIADKSIGKDFYPQKPIITFNEWQNILDYYEASSPDSLPSQKRKNSINVSLPLFRVIIPEKSYDDPATCFVKISENFINRFFISDAIKQSIYFFNEKLQLTDSLQNSGPVVDMDFQKKSILACNIGVLNPNNGKFGKVERFFLNAKGKYQKDTTALIDGLQRPVQILSADLNNDGKDDYITCEFGFLTGALTWSENLGNNEFKKHVLRPFPGAIKVYLHDYNHDGLMDIWALFSQGEEGVFLFTNKGKGNFDQKQVLRFPPSYGSSSFELTDFDKDGFPDIVYTCGDNADYSTVLKPYHGVYIFLNNQQNTFDKKFFFPINGCYKSITEDFDGDGDPDIATISFFADYQKQPSEGFVYLENKGNFEFQPYSIPEAKAGRWLTMDAGDINADGKPDLILGSFSIGPVMMDPKTDWKLAPAFIILKNIGN